MKKLLLLVFTATLVLFFTPNIFAQMGKTVKVANNSELIRAMNNPNVRFVEITQDGFYDAIMMDAQGGTVITKGSDASRSTCTFAITRTNKCFESDTSTNYATANLAGTGCPPQPSSGPYGWSTSTPGLTFTMASVYDYNATFTTTGPGDYIIKYTWNNLGDEAQASVKLFSSPEITQFEANPDTVCGDSTEITFNYDMGTQVTDTIVTWYVNGVVDNTLPTDPANGGSPFYFHAPQCGAIELVLSVTNTQGCGEDRDTLNLFFYDTPVTNAGDDDSVCGLVYTGLNGGYSGGTCYTSPLVQTWELDASFANAGTAQFYGSSPIWDSVVVSTCGAYQFVYTVENGLCSSSDTVAVYFYDKPTVNAGSDQEVCGLEAILSPSFTDVCDNGVPAIGVWSGTGLTFDGDTATAAACGTFEAVYTVTNGPCSTTDTVELKFYDTPIIMAGSDQEICGLEATLAPSFDAICQNGGTATGAWSGNGLTFSGDTLATAAACGTYEAVYTVTNGPCSNSDTVELKFYDTPTVNAGSDQEVCGLEATLAPSFNASCENGGTATGVWSGNGLTFSGDTLATAASCGSYEAVYTVTNGPCSNSDTIELKFYDTPIVMAGSDQEICGLEATLAPSFDAICANGGTATGAWSGNGLTFSGDTLATAAVCGTYEAVYTVTNGPCSNSDTVELKFYEAPAADAGSDSVNVCGLTATLNGTYAGGCTNGDTVVESWSVYSGGGIIHGDTMVEVTACGETVLVYKVSVGPCESTDTIKYKFTDYPVVTASGPGDVCGDTDANGVYTGIADLTGSFTANCVGDTTFNWTVCTQPVGSNVQWFPNADVKNPSVNVNMCGFYQFKFEVHNGPCVSVDTVSVKFYDRPVVDAGQDAEVCGDSLFLAPTWSVVCDMSAQGGSVSATWEVLGTPPGNPTFHGDSLVTVDACGTYTFIYHVMNGACCTCDTLVAEFYDTPVIMAGADQEICGLEATLAPTFDVLCQNSDTAVGVWSGNGLTFSGDTLATAAACGTYEAVYTVTNGPCSNSDTVKLEFYDTPVVMAGADQDICGLEATLTPGFIVACQNDDTATGVWSGAGLTFSGDTLATATSCGTYEAVYTVTNGPCSNSDTLILRFFDTPVVMAGSDQEICGVEATLAPIFDVICQEDTAAPAAGVWSGAGLTFSGDTLATAAVCGTYEAVYTVTNGPCENSDTLVLKFYDTPVVDAGQGDTLCDLTASLAGTHTEACTNGGTVNVLWTKVGGPGIVVFDNDTVDNTDVTVGQCGEYTFKYEVSNGPCSAFDTISFFFTDDPLLSAFTTADSVCGFGTYVTGSHAVSCGLNDTSWLTGTGPGNVTIVYDPNVIYDNYSILVDNCGEYDFVFHAKNGPCEVDTTFQITFFETPAPEIGGDTSVFTCSTTNFTATDPGCNDPASISYTWNVVGGAFASGVTTATGPSVDIIWDQNPGPAQIVVHADIADIPGCGGDDTLNIMKQEPTLEGQVKYWNSVETYMPSPYSTDDYSTIPSDYFYVILAIDDGANGLMDLDTAYVQPRLMEDLNELMSYFNFDLITHTYGCDARYFLRIWDGGFVYHTTPPAPQENTVLGNNYTWNNWGGVNATDALAIQLMAANVEVNAAPYNYTWVGNNAWSPSYGYYSQGIADVNHTFGNNGNNTSGITALDALTAKYRAVGLLATYPDNSDANNNQFRPNFMVTGRMVPSLPYITFPTPFDSTHVDDVPFTHSGNEYMYFQPATNHKYTSDSLPWGGKNNYINLYYESVGDVNASFIPPGSGLKAKSALTLDYEGLASTAIGSVMTVPVSVDRDVEVGAVTLSFNYRNDLIEVLGTNYTDDDMFINQEEGILNIAWFSTEGADFNADATIAQIRVKVLAEIPEGTELFELNTISELADNNAQPIADVTLKTIGVTTDKGIFSGTELTAGNFPNPSDAYTTISYTLPENGKVKVEVYNSVGMLVTTLVDETQESGVNNVKFTTGTIQAGVYFYHITVQGESNNYSAVKRMIVVH